ncbi:MAG: SAM-dependent methyltransferase [Prevotellaceae bacterium]|jgi:16S rRNA (cytidine1402-2'-O)-methyltransferase|nr:SAM-dependent methyltransferase [Prevotellaceae bacterium]
MYGTLFLIPAPLGEGTTASVIPPRTAEVARGVAHYVVENARSARRFLSQLRLPLPLDALHFELLNEHTPAADVAPLLAPLLEGFDVGLISEAGAPAVADPGAALVAAAHARGIRVAPLVGPSAIPLALMASGLNGQSFAFVGYLPPKPDQRTRRLRQLEQLSQAAGQTQLFIEAPYRNNQLMADIMASCHPRTLLCVAADLTLDTELVATRAVAEWRTAQRPDLNRRPCIFLLQA